MKNFKFYIILFLIFFIIIESLSFFIINKKKDLIKISLDNKIEIKPEIVKQYSEYIPHTRDKSNLDLLSDHLYLNKNTYFFNIIRNFEKKNSENILIQGDSWAESLNSKKSFYRLKNFSIDNDLGLINAGITSFSPSAMTSQLNILEKEFEIKPSIIIAIIDQTDIGDELFRYKSINNNLFSKAMTIPKKKYELTVLNNFNQLNFYTFKLIKYLYSYYLYHKQIFSFKNIEFIDFFYKQIKAKILKIPKILYPLQFGLNKNEKNIVKKRIKNYIEFAFKNNNLKMIYFVSHPHLKHINGGRYIINISTIIDEVISESELKININHINFSKLNESKNHDIYNQTDLFSHLTGEAYSEYFLPTILNKIEIIK